MLDVSAVPPRPAGAGRYILELARALGRRGDVDLWLVTRRDDASRFRELAPSARLVSCVPSPRPARLAYERLRLGRSIESLAAGTGRVYHGPHYTFPAGMRRGRVVTIHDVTFLEHPEWHETKKVGFFSAAIRRAAREAEVVVCVSATTATRLAGLVELRAELVVAEHGLDHGRFFPAPPDRRLLPPVLGGAGELVVHVGTLEPRKGLVELVEAFDELASRRPSLVLALAGQVGWGGATLARAVEAARARSRIHLLGFLPDERIVALMRAASVVVYPSREEGFGLPALEALAVGAPLVTTSGTAMAEFAGEAAFLTRPMDPSALSAAIAAALEAPANEREERRRIGTDRAARYTWERTAERHVVAYRRAEERWRERGRV